MEFTRKHASRLLTLAHFLRTEVKPKNFHMGGWLSLGIPFGLFNHTEDFREEEAKRIEALMSGNPECGTTACAAGWCPTVFPKDWTYGRESALPLLIDASCTRGMSRTGKVFRHLRGFFALDNGEVYRLFGGSELRSPVREARVIEKFVESKGYVYAD